MDLQQQLSDRDKTISELKQEIEVQAKSSDATIKMLKENVQRLKNQLLSTTAKPETMKEPVVSTATSFHWTWTRYSHVPYLHTHTPYGILEI